MVGHPLPMSKEDVEIQAEVRRKLKAMEEFYGFSPFVARYLSEQPDIFIPILNSLPAYCLTQGTSASGRSGWLRSLQAQPEQ